MPTPCHRIARRREAFTLVELLVVIVIIVILVGLLIPALSGARSSARKAATRSTMQSFLAACASFRTDKNRQPGAIPVDFLGLAENDARQASGFGITPMQSAILDLAGGFVGRGASVTIPNAASGMAVTFPGTNNRWVIDVFKIGLSDGPQYLKLNKESFPLVEGHLNQGKAFQNAGAYDANNLPVIDSNHSMLSFIPTMVDAEGNPVLLWQQDPLAADDAEFAAARTTDTAGLAPGQTPRPKFAWATNSGVLHATAIGRSARDQRNNTYLGGQAVDDNENDVAVAMQAVLGNPSFSINRDPPGGGTPAPYPSKARGELVLHAAGADGVFLQRKAAGSRVVYGGRPGSNEHAIDEFDDYTESQ